MERFLTVGGRTVKIPVLQVELLKQWCVVVFTLLSLLYIHKYYVQLLYDHNEHTLASCNVHV
jgi:hypothetical protein